MTFCFINLSQKNRYGLFITIIILNILQILFGLILFIFGLQTDIIIWKLTPVEKREIDIVFLEIVLFGILVIINQLICVKLVSKAYLLPYKKSTAKYLFYWIILGVLVVINGLLVAMVCSRTSQSLAEQIKVSLSRGLGQYLSDPTWHKILDEIQQGHSCCGVESFSDWHQTPWILMDYLVEDSETVLRYAESDARILPPVTPWSCCRADYEYPCFHDPIQQARYGEVWAQPHYALDSLHKGGCAAAVHAPFATTLTATIVMAVVLFLVQIIIILLLRLLFTSARNAVALGTAQGDAPGWVVGRGDFDGLVRGSPLIPTAGAIGANGKDQKRKRTDVTLKPRDLIQIAPGAEFGAGGQHKKRAHKDRHQRFSEFKSKVKNHASKARTCMLVKIDNLKKCRKTHGRGQGQPKAESSSEEEGRGRRRSPLIDVLMPRRLKPKGAISSEEESDACKIDKRKRKYLTSKFKNKDKSADRSDKSPLIKKKYKKKVIAY